MWWLLAVPAAVVVAALLSADSTPETPPSEKNSQAHPILRNNLQRLKMQLQGSAKRKVAFFGQPGAGKSTTLDILTEGLLQPRPRIGVATDMTDWSSSSNIPVTIPFGDMLFVDAPGYGTTKHPPEVFLAHFPFDHFDEVIVIVKGKLVQADERLIQHARKQARRLRVVQTHSDTLSTEEREIRRHDLCERLSLSLIQIHFIDNRTQEGITFLKRTILPGR